MKMPSSTSVSETKSATGSRGRRQAMSSPMPLQTSTLATAMTTE